MNDTVNEINTACINDAVEIVSRLKPIYTLKHARRQQEGRVKKRKFFHASFAYEYNSSYSS